MATVQCAVIKGDLPVDIVWSFNGVPINMDMHNGGLIIDRNINNPQQQQEHRDLVVRKSGSRASTLTIESVAARHAGIYSCSASNVAGSASHSADLTVNGTRLYVVKDAHPVQSRA